MSQPATTLAEPKDHVFTPEELKKFDGSSPETPIYVAIKGTVFDVSAKRDTYGPGRSYHCFTGKDASRALGKSTLKDEDLLADYSTLDGTQMKVLDDWHSFFIKRYNIVGHVEGSPSIETK
ncbi:progesterone binding protein [Hysterangium stoloniferum]|nr:progesterone binding protein [Hysterangium stoloniferum]